jgi:hypothetical protein
MKDGRKFFHLTNRESPSIWKVVTDLGIKTISREISNREASLAVARIVAIESWIVEGENETSLRL